MLSVMLSSMHLYYTNKKIMHLIKNEMMFNFDSLALEWYDGFVAILRAIWLSP